MFDPDDFYKKEVSIMDRVSENCNLTESELHTMLLGVTALVLDVSQPATHRQLQIHNEVAKLWAKAITKPTDTERTAAEIKGQIMDEVIGPLIVTDPPRDATSRPHYKPTIKVVAKPARYLSMAEQAQEEEKRRQRRKQDEEDDSELERRLQEDPDDGEQPNDGGLAGGSGRLDGTSDEDNAAGGLAKA